MKLWIGLLIGLLLLPAIGALVIAGGFLDISATSTPGSVERKLASYARDRWVARHAPKKTSGAPNEKQIDAGREHYRANCIVCHVAPEIPASELAKGMNPPPPRLDLKPTQARSDGELYWIVSQGIRMTGMPAFSPTHSESEISNVVAFIRRLPRLTDEDRSFLRRAVAEESEHHHAGSGEHAAESAKSAAPAPPPDPEDHGHSREHQHQPKQEKRK